MRGSDVSSAAALRRADVDPRNQTYASEVPDAKVSLARLLYCGGVTRAPSGGRTKRREAVEQLVKSSGGTLEAFYYAYGGDDFFIIVDLPDSVTTTAISLAVHTTGAVTFKTIVLITPEEVDAAVKKSVSYRPPGQ